MEIQFDHVSKQFDGKPVLQALTWQVAHGETWHIDGSSGQGKTTLLRLAMGLEHPTSGRITRAHGLRFAPVFQEHRLLPRLNAIHNLALVCPQPPAELAAALREVLEEGDLTQPAGTLSGGMQRRVAVMRALLAPADVLVLDEPFAGLDAANIDRLCRCILRRRAGRTILLSSHAPAAAFFEARRLRLDTNSAIMKPKTVE